MLVKLHLSHVIQLLILLQQGLLWAKMVLGPVRRLDPLLLLGHCFPWSGRVDLFDHLLPWENLVNNGEEPSDLGFVTGHHLEIVDKVVALSRGQQC
jgi:hypothetical protein